MIKSKSKSVKKKPAKAKPQATDPIAIGVVLDKSGSMQSIRHDAMGGFNTFLAQQVKERPEAPFVFVQFNESYKLLSDGAPIRESHPLNEETYAPSGVTALLDAIGKCIRSMEAAKNVPKKVLICIITDGQENASTEWSLDGVRKLIAEKRKQGWEFVFLGATEDSFTVGKSLGMMAGANVNFVADGIGTRSALGGGFTNAVSQYVRRDFMGGSMHVNTGDSRARTAADDAKKKPRK